MNVPMRITRDIFRLLGFGSDEQKNPREDKEEIEDEVEYRGHIIENGSNKIMLIKDDEMNPDGSLDNEERAKRRAERRRAKKKRQRHRKKIENIKDDKHEQNDQEVQNTCNIEERNAAEHFEENGQIEMVIFQHKEECTLPLAPTGNKNLHNFKYDSTEEEPEWDVNSAFVANAASHIKPKSTTKVMCKSKENKENETKEKGVNLTDSVKRSTPFAEKGIKYVEKGDFPQAIVMFTEALKFDPRDYRFFGNRSYCYHCLGQYDSALSDAEKSIQLAPTWPKGYFRKGRALLDLKRYSEAVAAFEMVLELDHACQEAEKELYACQVQQLMEMGFSHEHSVLLLEKFDTVQEVVNSEFPAKGLEDLESLLQKTSTACASLWVGNVTAEVKEKQLLDLFKSYGEINSIRILHERFCAFVNFKSAAAASRAKEKLQGKEIENTKLVIRYPDRHISQAILIPQQAPELSVPLSAQPFIPGSKRRGPVNGNECYFWRTTGCYFGDKCRYKHIPEHRSRDKRLLQS
ncbi:uncharacterized protein zgc:123010 isoform X1 [Polypterus senegalus]|uniref:uncharacterized protein zgc:123010 isoform X1 n=1 Tax=Polypterus senegalus TaxID=55291 RepID=UPI001964FCAB|nr:uncharacterized protein zgc:123010 isoform X1 [Polypterus senegalus]